MTETVTSARKKTEGSGGKRPSPLLFLFGLLALLLLLPIADGLVISDFRSGDVLLCLPLADGEQFSIRFTHSVNLSDVTDLIARDGRQLEEERGPITVAEYASLVVAGFRSDASVVRLTLRVSVFLTLPPPPPSKILPQPAVPSKAAPARPVPVSFMKSRRLICGPTRTLPGLTLLIAI